MFPPPYSSHMAILAHAPHHNHCNQLSLLPATHLPVIFHTVILQLEITRQWQFLVMIHKPQHFPLEICFAPDLISRYIFPLMMGFFILSFVTFQVEC